jgi:hypothetical protein
LVLKPCLLALPVSHSGCFSGHFFSLLLLKLCFLSSFGLLRPLGRSDLDGQVRKLPKFGSFILAPGPLHLAGFLLFPFSQPGISQVFSESEGPKLACRTHFCPSFQLPGRPAMHNACPADPLFSPLFPHVKQEAMAHKARHPHLVLAKFTSSASRPRGLVRSSFSCCLPVLSSMLHLARPSPHSLCMF